MMGKGCILLFLKYPEAGRVKTRLAASVGEEHAVALAALFAEEMFRKFSILPVDLCLCFDPPGAAAHFHEWFPDAAGFFPQQSGTVYQRMSHAFRDVFSSGYTHALLTGSDIPGISVDTVTAALKHISSGGSVIAPSFDGGYYLVGFHKSVFQPALFADPVADVDSFIQAAASLEQEAAPLLCLKKAVDVDTSEDLRLYCASSAAAGKIVEYCSKAALL